MATLKYLLELLSTYKGSIVSSASLSAEQIRQAQASGRIYVDENSLGYVWEPEPGFPTTEEEVKLFEKWYPLEVEMPEELKTFDWYYKYKKIENQKKNN